MPKSETRFIGGYRVISYSYIRAICNWLISEDYSRIKLRVLLAYIASTTPGNKPNIGQIKQILRNQYYTINQLEAALKQVLSEINRIEDKEAENAAKKASFPRRVSYQLAMKSTRYEALLCFVASMQRNDSFHLNQNRLANRFKVKQQRLSEAIKQLEQKELIFKVKTTQGILKKQGAKYAFSCHKKAEKQVRYKSSKVKKMTDFDPMKTVYN